MKEILRVDKFLADMGKGTRSEIKKEIKSGMLNINGVKINKPETKVNINIDVIVFKGEKIKYATYEYYMINKPAGVISASRDLKQKTIIDLIADKKRKDLFPVGRLDKDTEGLLLITNDGELSHNLLSPKKHVDKKYYARIEGIVTKEDIDEFAKGVILEDGYVTKPAELKIIKSDQVSQIEITIREGKFHQIKRMFKSVGKEVIYLKRLSMGTLELDENLQLGEYRQLKEIELAELKGLKDIKNQK